MYAKMKLLKKQLPSPAAMLGYFTARDVLEKIALRLSKSLSMHLLKDILASMPIE